MKDIQKCQKCGKVFSQMVRAGPSKGGIGDIMRQANTMTCPNCGGSVIWVNEANVPLSAHERMEEANRQLRLGCIWGIVAIIGLLAFFVAKYFIGW